MIFDLNREAVLALAIASMLIISGCSTTSPEPDPEPTESTPIMTPSEVSTTTTHQQTKQAESESSSISYGEVRYYNATESQIQSINDTMARFFEDLPENKSDRTAVVADIASKSCTAPTINETMFNSASFAHERSQQLYHVAKLMGDNFNSNINPVKIRKMARTSAKIGKYTTIVGSYNNYRDAACAFDKDDPETIEDYYLASATLGFELMMFQYGMYYKTAFKANRVLSHGRTYRVVQSTFGDEALSLMMSGSYWLTHGTLQAVPNFVTERADEMNLTIEKDDSNLSDHQRVGRFVGSNVVPQNITEAATQCYEKVVTGSEDEGLVDDALGFAEDISNEVLSGNYTVSDALESARGVNLEKLTDEQRKKIEECVKDKNS